MATDHWIRSCTDVFVGEQLWTLVVVDEAHRLKDRTSLLFRAMDKIPTAYRLCLTGTPIQNSIEELITLLTFTGQSDFPKVVKELKMQHMEEKPQLLIQIQEVCFICFIAKNVKKNCVDNRF